jgi:DNA-binding transcriptional MerR regulator
MHQDNQDERCYGIAELAERGGVTRRTVRYYVQRGLLPTPLGTGRGPHYTPAHLQRLIHIRKLQENGVPLAEIATRLDGVPQTPASTPEAPPERHTALRAASPHVLPAGETWMRFVLADGVELHVRAGAARLQPSQLARLVETTRHTLGLQTALYPSERSNTHGRNAAQLSDDVAPGPDPSPGRTP